MKFLYGPDERPPFSVSLPAGIQWAVISVAYILSFAMLIENIQGGNGAVTVAFIQKVLLITAAALVLQIFAGHRLPLVFGPSAALLIGISSSTGFTEGVIYGSMAVAAAAGVLIASTGLLAYISRLFTYRVITVVLLLISFTLIPVITPMFISSEGSSGSLYTLIFGLAVLAGMYLAQRFGGRIIRATLFLWVLIPGTLIYSLIFAYNPAEIPHFGLMGISNRIHCRTRCPDLIFDLLPCRNCKRYRFDTFDCRGDRRKIDAGKIQTRHNCDRNRQYRIRSFRGDRRGQLFDKCRDDT